MTECHGLEDEVRRKNTVVDFLECGESFCSQRCRRCKHKYLSLFCVMHTLIYYILLSLESWCGPELQVFKRTKQTLNEQLQGGGTATSCRSQKSRLGTHPTPVERPGEVISCSQRKNSDRRLGAHLQLIQSGKDPPHLQRDTQSEYTLRRRTIEYM